MAQPAPPLGDPQLGVLSFCDRPAFNVRSDAFKAAVVERLQRAGAHILRKHADPWVGPPVPGEHLLTCLRSHGNFYFMFLVEGLLLFVDRKIQPGYTLPRIILAHGRFDRELLRGTLLEGEMVKTLSGAWRFLVNDVLALEGVPTGGRPLAARLALAASLLAERHTPDATLDPCTYAAKRHEPFTEEGLAALERLKGEQDFATRGLLVRPPAGRARFIDFDADKVRAVVRPAKEVTEFRESPSQAPVKEPERAAPAPAPQPQGTGGTAEMHLRRTNLPDVYEVSRGQAGPPAGVAHVPTLAMSEALRAAFRAAPTGTGLPFPCVFRDLFRKWEPVCG